MPRDGDFKRLVRRRMRKTGEAYTTARAQLARRPAREGRAVMQPFDRFSPRARRALAAAHAAAAASTGDIDAGRLLHGLLGVEDGMAAKVLDQLGVDRLALALGLAPEAGPAPAVPRLTHEAGRAIELAVREAAALGHAFIGTEHLLLGILAGGGSSASQALADAGADLERVRQRVRREPRAVPAAPRADAWRPLPPGGVVSLLEHARRERLTGTMRVRRSAADVATLYFLFGHLFHAVNGEAAGDDAVLAAMAWPEGEVAADFDGRSRLPADGTVRATIPQLVERAKLGG
jgi:Clp amino terminal domain, pathogenicity island component